MFLIASLISWGLYQTDILPIWVPIVLTCLAPIKAIIRVCVDEN